MENSTKQYVDQAFGLLTLVAFAVPVVGAGVAAGIGGLQLAFDIIVGPGEPMPALATSAELAQVEQTILNAINDTTFATALRKYEADLKGYNDTLVEALGVVITRTVDDPTETLAQTKWESYCNKNLLPYLGTSSPVLQTINRLETLPSGSPQDYTTIGAYTLAASVHIGFCKLAMVTEWNNEVVAYFAACDKVVQNNLNFQAQHIIWQKAHDAGQPNIGAEPQAETPPDPPEPFTILKGGPSFVSIQDHLPTFIAHLSALLADYRGAFEAREKLWNARLDAIQEKTSGSNFYYVDTVTGHTSAPKARPEYEDDYSTLVGQLWGEMMENAKPFQFGMKAIDLTNVNDVDLKVYEAILKTWQDAQSDYPPPPAKAANPVKV